MSTNKTKPLASEQTAYWRVLGMADATSTDLTAAYEAGQISHEAWGDTVQRCRGCRWAEGCDQWLAAGNGSSRPVPAACRNSDLFERLTKA